MKKVSIIIALVSLLCFAVPQAAARSSASRRNAGNLNCQVKFHNLSRYKSDSWSRVFRDREVAPALKGLLKTDYRNLVDSLEHADYPEGSLSFVDNKGVLTLEGGVKGLGTITEAILIVEPCGNIYAAILDLGKRILYYTNNREFRGKLPPAIEQWRTSLEGRRSSTSSQPELPVLFKSR